MNKNTIRLKKLTTIFIIAFFILATIQILPSLFKREPKGIPSFKKNQIHMITLIYGNNEAEIQQINNQWVVKGTNGRSDYPADLKHIEELLQILLNLKKTEVVSTNPDKYALFEVDGRRVVTLEFNKGMSFTKAFGRKTTIYIGTPHAFNSTYFRVLPDKKVYSTNSDLTLLFYPFVN